MMDALRAEVAAFLEREAALLDERRFEEWVGLYLPDCVYWVPVSPAQESPKDGVSHFHDDIQLMMARTHRLANPRVYGAEPPPVTAHVVSGVRIEQAAGDEIVAVSTQVMVEYRERGGFEADQRVFAGRVTHRLKRTPDGLKIAQKRIDLVNAGGSFNAMTAPL
jgi:3-phenylpropionate/cinnamic acid dioxygenase small subunit